jgi:hypothetical protein
LLPRSWLGEKQRTVTLVLRKVWIWDITGIIPNVISITRPCQPTFHLSFTRRMTIYKPKTSVIPLVLRCWWPRRKSELPGSSPILCPLSAHFCKRTTLHVLLIPLAFWGQPMPDSFPEDQPHMKIDTHAQHLIQFVDGAVSVGSPISLLA